MALEAMTYLWAHQPVKSLAAMDEAEALLAQAEPEDRPAWVAEARTEPLMAEGAAVLASILPERWVAQSVGAADEATRAAGQAIETGKAVQPLAEPIFKTPAIETRAGQPVDPGYKDQERKDLERLIQSSQ